MPGGGGGAAPAAPGANAGGIPCGRIPGGGPPGGAHPGGGCCIGRYEGEAMKREEWGDRKPCPCVGASWNTVRAAVKAGPKIVKSKSPQSHPKLAVDCSAGLLRVFRAVMVGVVPSIKDLSPLFLGPSPWALVG